MELRGRTVLITRPREQARELAATLRRYGAQPVEAPAIRIAAPTSWGPLDEALRSLKRYDALVFTSANGVERFFERSKRVLKGRPHRPPRVYAIGPATAKALRDRGWVGVDVPERFEGEALAKHLSPVTGRRILIPRARVARDVLPKVLARRGAEVRVVEAYRTVADAPGLKALRRAAASGKADIVTFTSSSTVEHVFRALGPARARRFLRLARPASIGPITSDALRRRGVEPWVEAAQFSIPGLIEAILEGPA